MDSWADQANCLGQDTEDFFADEQVKVYQNIALLRRICGNCDVQKACLNYALHNNVLGYWGNTTENQRKTLRKELGIIAVPVVSHWEYA